MSNNSKYFLTFFHIFRINHRNEAKKMNPKTGGDQELVHQKQKE
jgi:hypothetical protein